MAKSPEARRRWPEPVLVALCRSRIAARAGAKLGWLGAAAVVVAFVGIGLAGRGAQEALAGLLTTATRWILWAAMAPLALSIAYRPLERDREEGVELLALSAGRTEGELGAARWLAAIWEMALRATVPVLMTSIVLAVVAAGPRVAVHGLLLMLFGGISSLLVASLAIACGYYAGRRGRWVLAAVVVFPWALSDMWRAEGWSLPGALDAALVLLTRWSEGMA